MRIKVERVLIIEDNRLWLDELSSFFFKSRVTSASSLSEAFKIIQTKSFDLYLIDVRLPDGSGLDLLKRLRKRELGPSVMMSAINDPKVIEDCLSLGADAFLLKDPAFFGVLELNLQKIFDERRRENHRKTLIKASELDIKIFNKAAASKSLKRLVDVIIKTQWHSLLIEGPNGSGKTMIAKYLHQRKSPELPFLKVNCASLKRSGFERSFFGTQESKSGFFDLAGEGTLLLDGIDNLTPRHQRMLHECIKDREFIRLGSTHREKIHCKIICTTTENLKNLVSEQSFSPQLYYQICALKIDVPSLSERREDMSSLIDLFIEKLAPEMRLHPLLKSNLLSLDWPGNAEELENALRECVIHARLRGSKVLLNEDLKSRLSPDDLERFLPKNTADISDRHLTRFLETAEAAYWIGALELFDLNLSKLSRKSKIPLSTLNFRLKKLGISVKSLKPSKKS